MIDLDVESAVSLRSRPPRPTSGKTWLMRGFFLSLHAALIIVTLIWVGILPPISSGRTEPAKPPAFQPIIPANPNPAPQPLSIPQPTLISRPTPPIPVVGKPTTPSKVTVKPVETPSKSPSLGVVRGLSEPLVEEAGPSPAEVLEANGLTRDSSGTFLVLEGEQACIQGMKSINAVVQQLPGVTCRLLEIKANDDALARLYADRVKNNYEVDFLKNYLDGLPSRGNNFIVDEYNNTKANLLNAKNVQAELKREIGQLELARPSARERQDLALSKTRLDASFREQVPALRLEVDAVVAKFQELARDEDVKAAIDRMAREGDRVNLGLSSSFLEVRKGLVDAERELAGTPGPRTRGR